MRIYLDKKNRPVDVHQNNIYVHELGLTKKDEDGFWSGVFGIQNRWWPAFDIMPFRPVPWPKRVNIHDYAERNSMAAVMCDLDFFASMKEAKRAGWNKPVTLGIHTIRGYTIIVSG